MGGPPIVLSLEIYPQIAPEVLIGIVALKIRLPGIHIPFITVIEVIFTFFIFHKSSFSDYWGCCSSSLNDKLSQVAQEGNSEFICVL